MSGHSGHERRHTDQSIGPIPHQLAQNAIRTAATGMADYGRGIRPATPSQSRRSSISRAVGSGLTQAFTLQPCSEGNETVRMWRKSVAEACLVFASLDREEIHSSFSNLLKNPDDSTCTVIDQYDRSLECDLDEYTILEALRTEIKFATKNLRLAFNVMDKCGEENIEKSEWIRFSPLMNLCDEFSAEGCFEALVAEFTEKRMTFQVLSRYIDSLQRVHRENKKWEDLKVQRGFDRDEVMLRHTTQASDCTTFSLGHPGYLFLSTKHLFYESPIIRRPISLKLSEIDVISKKTAGLFGVDNGIEITCFPPNSSPYLLAFPIGERNRWYDYILEMVTAYQQIEPNHGDEAIVQFVGQNILRSRAIRKYNGGHTTSFFISKHTKLCAEVKQKYAGGDKGAGAVVRGLISTFVGEEEAEDEEDEAFQYKKMVANIDVAISLITPMVNAFGAIGQIFTWENRSLSLLAMFALLYLSIYDLLAYLPALFLLWQCGIIAFYGVKREFQRIRMQHSGGRLEEVALEPPKEKASIFSILKGVQNTAYGIDVFLLKVRNLYTWKTPWMSRAVMIAFAIIAAVSVVVPFRFLFMGVVIHIFTIQNLFNWFPKFKREYDTVSAFWESIPADPDAEKET